MVPRDDHESSSSSSSSRAPGRLPSLNLPPRNSMENLFTVGPTSAGVSPGPMSLVSRFFSENDPDSDCRSFSQLLSGAISSSPAAAVRPNFRQSTTKEEGGGNMELRLQQSRPTGLVVTQPSMFTIPPGLSPATLLDSPGLFSYTQQQVMVHLTAQSAQAQEQIHIPAERTSLSSAPAPRSSQLEFMRMHPAKKRPAPVPDPGSTNKESPDVSSPGQKSQPCITGDKPADDGYNWRKYGQKQVKGSEFPRSYYKCTHQNCPVKKKVERSHDGQVTEIIYKGQHNHQPPPSSKRAKEGGNTDGTQNLPWSMGLGSTGMAENMNTRDHEFGHADPENASRSSDSDDVGGAENGADGGDDDEPELKRRNIEVQEPAMLHRTVTEPRIIVQTTSEVDLLDDGYRWRKYGQKVVKGNPYPRSYYKCTFSGCNVRKHVERAANDPKAVITTYESKHSHDVPAAKNSGPSTAGAPKPPNSAAENAVAGQRIEEFKIMEQQPLAFLRFKEEQMT